MAKAGYCSVIYGTAEAVPFQEACLRLLHTWLKAEHEGVIHGGGDKEAHEPGVIIEKAKGRHGQADKSDEHAGH